MRSNEYWRAWSGMAAFLALLAAAPVVQAANVSPGPDLVSETIQTRFDPVTRQTQVAGKVASDLCFHLSLPDEWRRSEEGLKAVVSHVELGVSLRSARELRDMPQPDLASRDAAFLQRDYEELLGRPAQSVSVSSNAGAMRWSATWVDVNLPTASHAMTVETLIVPLSNEWVLELSLSGAETQGAYNTLAQRLLTNLKVQGRGGCQA
ncbi:hypothetical protein JKG68_14295 [Microvirga aerilata]|uniref:ABC-type transport auxiliary lipoprotein component domain-containing protein n=2 Tax=Microvirga aerilata TaxID=670292 RepID=A0A936ZE23_9HYPH|nr:hypothetical protein [Microvirga aerilata]